MRLHQPLSTVEALERFLSDPAVAATITARRVLPARQTRHPSTPEVHRQRDRGTTGFRRTAAPACRRLTWRPTRAGSRRAWMGRLGLWSQREGKAGGTPLRAVDWDRLRTRRMGDCGSRCGQCNARSFAGDRVERSRRHAPSDEDGGVLRQHHYGRRTSRPPLPAIYWSSSASA